MGTRDRILHEAKLIVLSDGFERTTIDRVAETVGVSRGGVLYHFPDKNALAEGLMQEFIAENDAVFDDVFGRAAHLSDDPLHCFLIGLKMLADIFADLPEVHPGCLVANAVYQERLYERGVHELIRTSVKSWRTRFCAMLEQISRDYPANIPINQSDLADMLSACVDGGIILSKTHQDARLMSAQIGMYRSFVKLVYSPQRGDIGAGPDQATAAAG